MNEKSGGIAQKVYATVRRSTRKQNGLHLDPRCRVAAAAAAVADIWIDRRSPPTSPRPSWRLTTISRAFRPRPRRTAAPRPGDNYHPAHDPLLLPAPSAPRTTTPQPLSGLRASEDIPEPATGLTQTSPRDVWKILWICGIEILQRSRIRAYCIRNRMSMPRASRAASRSLISKK